MDGGSTAARYARLGGPWGPIHVAVADGALVAVEVLAETAPFVAAVERRLGRRAEPARSGDRLIERVEDEIARYLTGRLRSFEVPVALVGRSEWDRAILDAVAETPWGEVTSYGRLARRVGRPGAARAAGGAVGRNPVGLVVPCHRVIAGDGGLGGYGGAWFGTREPLLAIKRQLLELEGVSIPARRFAD